MQGTSALLLFAMLILAGMAGGSLARKLRAPALIGQILAGVMLGPSFLKLINPETHASFQPVSALVLSVIAVTVGGHLEFRRLHNARRRILLIALCETTLTFALVFLAFHLLNPFHLAENLRLPVHLIVASISTSTSPVAVIHIIKEREARGLLVKTVIAVVAVDNLITISAFELFNSFSIKMLGGGTNLAGTVGRAGLAVLLSVAIGALAGLGLDYYCRRLVAQHGPDDHLDRRQARVRQGLLFTGLLVAMCAAAGLCDFITDRTTRLALHLSPVLANMTMGLVLANRSSFKEDLLGLFEVLEYAIFTSFFVLAGSHLELDTLRHAGLAAAVYFAMRLTGKAMGGYLGSRISRTTGRLTRHFGFTMIPQGAIAVALTIAVREMGVYAEVVHILTACILASCVLSELVGAKLFDWTIHRAGEARRDRTRLIEFLDEEFILPRLHARDKGDVLELLSYFICRTQPILVSAQDLIRAVKEREASMPTGLAEGIAVPHAKIEGGKRIAGALALLDPPIDFGAPDGVPARLVVMVITPKNLAHKHLEVIAAVSRMLRDRSIREALFAAHTAEEIHEIIDSEEAETFNYFLET